MTMNHEVISAFLDDEPFDATELSQALADPGGREALIDLVALRHLVQPIEGAGAPAMASRPSGRAAWWMAAAALLVVGAGGFAAGRQSATPAVVSAPQTSDAAPAPTRVIDLKPGVNWHETKGGF